MKAIFNFFAATSQEYQRKELWELMKAALSTMNEPGTALDLTKKLEALLCTFFLLLRDKEEKDGEVKLEIFPAGSEEQIDKERNSTPTSAITASHRVAMPPAPKAKTITLTPIANAIFC
nr:hypothetical protein [uncultured Pedobacter sp.]